MTDRIEALITDAIWTALETQEHPMGGPYVDRDMGMIDASGSEVDMKRAVEHILAALKAARIECVELKSPDDEETGLAQEWATSSALCARRFLGPTGDPDRIYVWDKAHAWDHGPDPITPTQARELAAALLSAADAAEASQ